MTENQTTGLTVMALSDLDTVLERVRRSPFRQRFHLFEKERTYLHQKGMDVVLSHALEFVEKRLAPANPANDGKQTPWRNHPVFIAQHATGTCCRGCLEKWHGIPKGKALDESETQYIVTVIGRWLEGELGVKA